MFKLNPELRWFWATKKPYKRLRGGRFSGKTHDAAGFAVFLARNYSLKFLCIRQFQNRISDSVYTVLKEKIETAGWSSEFRITNSTIEHRETGSIFIFYGIARNIADIKGTEGVDICWIEEAEGLTETQWEYIDPTIRKEGSEIWFLWNPRLTSDFIETKLPVILGDDSVTTHINYDKNCFLSDTAKKKAERLKELDPEGYEHIYLGVARSDDDMAIIKRSWCEAAKDAHLKLDVNMSGVRCVGYDVADSGEDKNAIVVFNGSIACEMDEWKAPEDELKESALRAWSFVGGGSLIYDSIGVGAHTGSTLKSKANKNIFKFNAGASVVNPRAKYAHDITNKDKFENLKAQAWQDVADRLRNTYNAVNKGEKFEAHEMISIDTSMTGVDDLVNELCTPRVAYSNNGKDMVESKKDLARRDVNSPNRADAFIMGASKRLIARSIGRGNLLING